MNKLTGLVFLFIVLCFSCNSKEAENQSDQNSEKAPNVIFLIGDGMGLSQISLAIEQAQDNLSFGKCSHIGFIKTSSLVDYITDSAAGATAFSTGQKTKNRHVATDSLGNELPIIMKLASERGWFTAIAASASLTHATPASFYAHSTSRYAYKEIANQFYHSGVNIAFASGMPYFSNDSFSAAGYSVFTDLDAATTSNSERFVYFMTDSIEVASVEAGRKDLLPKCTEVLINTCSKQDKPFFAMIEGSQIDWGGHANDAEYVVSEMMDFNQCIKLALAYLENDPNTLIVVTADHETGGLTLLQDSDKKVSPHFVNNKHTGIIVPVFAFGKGAESFSGIYENTEIHSKLMKIMKLN